MRLPGIQGCLGYDNRAHRLIVSLSSHRSSCQRPSRRLMTTARLSWTKQPDQVRHQHWKDGVLHDVVGHAAKYDLSHSPAHDDQAGAGPFCRRERDGTDRNRGALRRNPLPLR